MSVTVMVPIPDELVPLLKEGAVGEGMSLEEFAGELVQRELSQPRTLPERSQSGGVPIPFGVEQFGHLLLVAASFVLAFMLRFDFFIPPSELTGLYWGLALAVPIKLIGFYLFGFRLWLRNTGVADLALLFLANLAVSAACAAAIFVLARPSFYPSISVLDFLLCFNAIGLTRLGARLLYESTVEPRQAAPERSNPILEERYQLIAEKLKGGLSEEKTKRLLVLDEQLVEREIRQADDIDQAYNQTPPGKLDSNLDRLEQYIKTIKSRAS